MKHIVKLLFVGIFSFSLILLESYKKIEKVYLIKYLKCLKFSKKNVSNNEQKMAAQLLYKIIISIIPNQKVQSIFKFLETQDLNINYQ